MFCNKCASKIPDGSIFCPECGQKLTVAQPQPAAPQVPLRRQSPYPQTYRQAPQAYPDAAPVYGSSGYGSDPLGAPLSTGSFFWMPVIIAIPIVGFILLLVWAFSKNTNLNRKHYARSVLLWGLIGAALTAAAVLLGGNLFGNLQGILSSL